MPSKIGRRTVANRYCTLHSACFTGDIWRSLNVDCGPAAHAAMPNGVRRKRPYALYLTKRGADWDDQQDARLFLKIRDLDTVEATTVFGFEDDERILSEARIIR